MRASSCQPFNTRGSARHLLSSPLSSPIISSNYSSHSETRVASRDLRQDNLSKPTSLILLQGEYRVLKKRSPVTESPSHRLAGHCPLGSSPLVHSVKLSTHSALSATSTSELPPPRAEIPAPSCPQDAGQNVPVFPDCEKGDENPLPC